MFCLGLGCGPQETFRNCADVRVLGSRGLLPPQDNPRALFVTDERGIRPLVVRSQICVATPSYRMFHRSVSDSSFLYQEEANVQRSHTKLNSEYLKCNTHSWAQRKLSPLNILLLITGPLLSLGFNGFND